jgi:A/G-specific adenine glycosylase
VIPKWEAFVATYPTPASCAAASLGDVLRLWQGLGYPRRAKSLHAAAVAIVEQYDGVVPADLDSLLALPGIGPYTARAVLAFAYERDVAVVDTNIARVLARTAGTRLTAKEAQASADELVPRHEGWAWNQILMDLGAVVCRPTPDCGVCPLEPDCRWARAGRPTPDPAVGSAGVSTRQPRFEGSDRQARGRVLATLVEGSARTDDFDRRILQGLVADGLVVVTPDGLASLP